MKNKQLIILVVVIALVLLIGGGVAFLASRNSADTSNSSDGMQQDVLPTLSPDEIGLKITVTPDKKRVQFLLEKPQSITGVDYELTYKTTDEQDRGVIGQIEVKPEDSVIQSKQLDLGSCSKNICKYDTDIHGMQLSLKITKSDGKVYQTVKDISL